MRKFKEGDKAIVLKNTSGHGFSIGAEVEVVGESGIYNGETEYECKTISEYWFLTTSELKKKENLEYKTSNRHKLQQAIKATGFHAEKLSLASNHAKTYFTGFTAESRFNSRGDITEDRLNSLLTTLAFAERELLGVGAKTVEDQVKPEYFGAIGDVEIKGALVEYYDNELDANLKAIDDSKINEQTKLYSEYFDSANKRIQQKKYSKVRNFLIVFLIFIVILSIYFFTR